MKNLAKDVSQRLGVYNQASRFWIWLRPIATRATRMLTARDRALIDRYLACHPVARLHIGCGHNELAGWLNTDQNPGASQIYLDATRPFPLPDNRFDTVYCEHMIEHITWHGSQAMLRECYRVMKPGGTLRIVTPDLSFFVRILREPDSPQHVEYIRYSMQRYGIDGPADSAAHVVNNFVRAWGHQFIYDDASLRRLMRDSGLTDITACGLSESGDRALTGVAKADRMPAGFLAMESLVLEGRKPWLPQND